MPQFAFLMAAAIVATSAAATPGTEQAKALILSGQLEDARAILDLERVAHPGDIEPLFLLGILEMEEKHPRQAVDLFRAALVHDPNAVRIRLELARAFFEAGQYGNAQRQFERARAGNPPAPVIAMIDRYAVRIRQDRRWSYELDLALAPDSNINGATSAREAMLFGVPFELGEDARRKSGVGVAVSGRATFAPAITEGVRLRLSASINRRDYLGHRFDDTVAGLEAGPELAKGKWRVGLIGSGFVRRIGPNRRMRGGGGRLDLSFFPDSRTVVPVSLAVQRIRFNDAPSYDSTLVGLEVGVGRALTPATAVAARLQATRRRARAEFASSRGLAVGLAASHDFAGGFTVRAEPRIEWTRFDADDPFALAPRRDKLRDVSLSLLNRRIRMAGFTPRIGLTLAHRASTVDLYSYRQRRLEVGITSDF